MGIRDRLKGRARTVVKKAARAIGLVSDDRRGAATAMREALASLPTEPDAQGYRAVVTSELLTPGTGNTFVLDGHNIAIFRTREGELFAIDDACNHEDGPLGEADLDGCVITCAYHGWRYDLRSGDCLTDPDRPIGCYAVHEHDGFIWVGPKTREGSRERGGEHDDGLMTVTVEG